jgi:prepilin-type N-terminal cleavage/methylation domain-containing protein
LVTAADRSPKHQSTNPPIHRRTRRGLSLIEVIVSLGILGGALMGMSAFAMRLAQATTRARIRATAGQLISDRLESVKSAPRYVAIDSLYAGLEGSIPGFPGFVRQTWVKHVGGGPSDTIDYRLITVEVRNPKLGSNMRKTSAIPPF